MLAGPKALPSSSFLVSNGHTLFRKPAHPMTKPHGLVLLTVWGA